MVRDAKTMQIKSILLWCDTCKCATKHVLTASGNELVCACGTSIEYHNAKNIMPLDSMNAVAKAQKRPSKYP